jgi:arsenate-mycothiol transferase
VDKTRTLGRDGGPYLVRAVTADGVSDIAAAAVIDASGDQTRCGGQRAVHPGPARGRVDITDQTPKQITQDVIAAADRVIVLGREAQVAAVDGTPVDHWDTDEPSERGIDGVDRMRLVRDDIDRRVRDLAQTLARDRAGLDRQHG